MRKTRLKVKQFYSALADENFVTGFVPSEMGSNSLGTTAVWISRDETGSTVWISRDEMSTF